MAELCLRGVGVDVVGGEQGWEVGGGCGGWEVRDGGMGGVVVVVLVGGHQE